jgi:hypothetical protein
MAEPGAMAHKELKVKKVFKVYQAVMLARFVY